MKIEDMLQALPSREDIATAIGLRPQVSTTGDMLTAFGIFGTGMMLGAGVALLFATKSGHQLRHDIVEKVGELGGHFRVQAPQPASTSANPLNASLGFAPRRATHALNHGCKGERDVTAASDCPAAPRLRWPAELGLP